MITRLVVIHREDNAPDSRAGVYPVGVCSASIRCLAARIESPPHAHPPGPGAAASPRPQDATPAFSKFVVGLRALANRSLDQAAQSASEFVEIRPDSPAGRVVLSDILRKLGRLDSADDHLCKAASLAPQSAMVRLYRGDFLVSMRRYDDGIRELTSATELRPNYLPGIRLLLAALVAAKKYPEAERLGRDAVALARDNAWLWADLGLAMRGQGKHDDALRFLRKASALYPESNQCRAMLAGALAESGSLDEAEECYADLTKREEQNPAVWFRYACFLASYRPTKRQDALHMLEKAEFLNQTKSAGAPGAVSRQDIARLKKRLEGSTQPSP